MADKLESETDAKPTRLIGKQSLKALVSECKTYDAKTATASGEKGAAIKAAIEKKNLHRSAFSKAYALENMEDAKRAEWFEHFDHYVETLGLRNTTGALALGDREEPAKPKAPRAGPVLVGDTAH